MKTLHTYLTRQVLASLLMTVATFTFVLLLGNVLKEILTLLINRQATMSLVVEAVGLLIPFVWVFALPMGMLTATLLIFGRFSADQELTAVRASGVSLLSLITPVLLLSIALCGVSALVNMEIGPRCRVAYTRMLSNIRVELGSAQLPEGVFIKDFKDHIFYVGRNRRGNLEDVMVFILKDETNLITTVRAPRGKLEIDMAARRLTLKLFDIRLIATDQERSAPGASEEWNLELDFNTQKKGPRKAKVSDMTFSELRNEIREVERTFTLPTAAVAGLTPEQLQLRRKELQRQREEMISPLRFHVHRQIAFSFACFGFTLVGIPLAIRLHRRETNIGIALALVLALIYYGFVLTAQSLDSSPEFVPHLLIWVPNFLFQAVGAVMLWRANRGV